MMELFPQLRLGWLNGSLLLAALYGVYGLMLLVFPRDVVARLYDRPGWSKEMSKLSAMRMLFALWPRWVPLRRCWRHRRQPSA
jgi:hypothetical protein